MNDYAVRHIGYSITAYEKFGDAAAVAVLRVLRDAYASGRQDAFAKYACAFDGGTQQSMTVTAPDVIALEEEREGRPN